VSPPSSELLLDELEEPLPLDEVSDELAKMRKFFSFHFAFFGLLSMPNIMNQ
jgi:hypothetical protein